MATGIIFDIKRYCVHDGPGLRTTVFMKGCPLRCRWCHNPEGQSPSPDLLYRSSLCIRCGACADNCPNRAIHSNGNGVAVDRGLCNLCGVCVRLCPTGGIDLVGKEYDVPGLLAEVAKDRVFFEESGGGVTFSGGEPLSNPEFLREALQRCREMGIHTVVDTCGFASPETLESVRPYVDLFLYDVKLMDRARHLEFTGVANDRILENLKLLVASGSDVIVVLPLIPGVNDDDRNVDELAAFVQDLGLGEISLLPYHRTGLSKFGAMGRPDAAIEFEEPSERRVGEVTARLERFGLEVRVGKR